MPADMPQISEVSESYPAVVDWPGIGMVVASTLGFSTSIIFTRLIFGMEALHITFFRSLFAFLFFCFLLPWHPETLKFSTYRGAIKYLIGLGISVAATCVLYIYALRHTTAANSVLLNNSAAVYVVLVAPWLLKEVRPRYAWLSLLLAVVGIVCVTDPAQMDWHSGSFSGIVAATLSGITYAGVIVSGRLIRGQVGGATQAWWSTGITALLSAPWLFGVTLESVSPNLFFLLGLGIIALGLPYMIFFIGLQRVSAQVASFAVLLEPVCGVLIGLFLFQEIPSVLGVFGIFMILGSIFLISQ
ncbi:MAG: DMT family transporter [Anaerolineae bacterium]|jgi:drug/metabolite transporter (DMT)-like permease|nr:DMT family transporter [Anaerolineae bacterium]